MSRSTGSPLLGKPQYPRPGGDLQHATRGKSCCPPGNVEGEGVKYGRGKPSVVGLRHRFHPQTILLVRHGMLSEVQFEPDGH